MKRSIWLLIFSFSLNSFSQDNINLGIENNFKKGTELIEEKKFEEAITSLNKGIKVAKSIDNSKLIAFGKFHLKGFFLNVKIKVETKRLKKN